MIERSLSWEQREILYASCLVAGTLSKSGKNQARYTETRPIAEKEILLWKMKQLDKLGFVYKEYEHKRKKKKFCSLASKPMSFLSDWREMLYDLNYNRRIPLNTTRILFGRLALAVLCIDIRPDGSLPFSKTIGSDVDNLREILYDKYDIMTESEWKKIVFMGKEQEKIISLISDIVKKREIPPKTWFLQKIKAFPLFETIKKKK